MKRFSLLLGLLLLALSAFRPATAQEELPGVFGEVFDVRVVNVEVVVTDRDGVRVSGLGPQDFRLVVDGEEVPVEYFSEVLGGVVAEPSGRSPGLPQLTSGEPVGTSYLLFIDDYFSIARDRNRVLEALVEDLPVVASGDRMAIVAYDGKRLEMLSSWTDSGPQLERALKTATRREATGLHRLSELRTFQSDRQGLGRAPVGSPPNRLSLEEERYAQELASQVERAVTAAAATLRGFASPPGRKIMLVLSGGWPYFPAEYAIGRFDRIADDRDIPGGEELFRPLTQTANRLGYTLYPVDVPGLQGASLDVARGGVPEAGQRERAGFLREQGLHSSLAYLAEKTGGKVALNAARLDSLPLALEDTRSYYWLGFSPQWKGDDGVHDVEVRVVGTKYKVRSRSSFLDLSRSQQITNMVESSLLFGNPPSSRPLHVKFGAPKRAGIGKVRLPMEVLLPAKEIAMLPGKDGYSAVVELRVAAINADGESSEVTVQQLGLTQKEAPSDALVLRFSSEIKLRKAEHDLIVSIYDPASGALLAARKTVIPHR